MKRVGKPVFFVVVAMLALLTYAAFFGVSSKYGDIDRTYIKGAQDIRWGIDIRGGVDVTFSPPDGVDATDDELSAAEAVIKTRLLNQNITDSEVYTDNDNDRIIVRFPWKSDEQNFNPEQAIEELGKTAQLRFYKDTPIDGLTGGLSAQAGDPVLTGADVQKAEFAMYQQSENGTPMPVVTLEFKEEAKESGNKKESLVKTYISYGFSFILSTLLLYLQVNILGISQAVAPIINIMITTPINFLMNKFWTFAKKG